MESMKEDYDTYLVAFDNITNESNSFRNNMVQEDEHTLESNENNNKENEDIEMKDENPLNENQQNLNESENKDENMLNNDINQNQNINKNNDQSYKNSESNNTINIVIPTKTIKKENKISKEYDYGYSILYINEEETGIMEDFLNDRSNESTTKDCFNFGLDESKWIKFLNHSILVHYKKKYNEFLEIKKLQNMYINNGNGNNEAHGIMGGMNTYMINYYQNMNLNNLKTNAN